MFGTQNTGFCLLLIVAGTTGSLSVAQESGYRIVDFVSLPTERSGNQESDCSFEFLEYWMIDPLHGSISKEVVDYETSLPGCQEGLAKKGSLWQDQLTYEFILLDPHLIESGNMAFPEPDSMDLPTRRLQGDLIALICENSHPSTRYYLQDQLLSMFFHERWTIDSKTQRISKQVLGITPVIWQRRQTEAGEPVNDAETGLPVYYKNQLQRIDLRNP